MLANWRSIRWPVPGGSRATRRECDRVAIRGSWRFAAIFVANRQNNHDCSVGLTAAVSCAGPKRGQLADYETAAARSKQPRDQTARPATARLGEAGAVPCLWRFARRAPRSRLCPALASRRAFAASARTASSSKADWWVEQLLRVRVGHLAAARASKRICRARAAALRSSRRPGRRLAVDQAGTLLVVYRAFVSCLDRRRRG